MYVLVVREDFTLLVCGVQCCLLWRGCVDAVSVLQLGGGGTWSVSLVLNKWPEKKKKH
jgi:hypothetical protein